MINFANKIKFHYDNPPAISDDTFNEISIRISKLEKDLHFNLYEKSISVPYLTDIIN